MLWTPRYLILGCLIVLFSACEAEQSDVISSNAYAIRSSHIACREGIAAAEATLSRMNLFIEDHLIFLKTTVGRFGSATTDGVTVSRVMQPGLLLPFFKYDSFHYRSEEIDYSVVEDGYGGLESVLTNVFVLADHVESDPDSGEQVMEYTCAHSPSRIEYSVSDKPGRRSFRSRIGTDEYEVTISEDGTVKSCRNSECESSDWGSRDYIALLWGPYGYFPPELPLVEQLSTHNMAAIQYHPVP